MEDHDLMNPFEGQIVDHIVWPFYRYKALLPRQIGADLFVWLYISLIIFQNENKGYDKFSYSHDVKADVITLIKTKFGSVIDEQTMEKIVSNAESDFVENSRLKPEADGFVDTYENLFSDKLDIKYVFQDAITGEVVPFFGDSSDIDDSSRKENELKSLPGIKEPVKYFVKKAYDQYIKLKKYNADNDFSEMIFEEDEPSAEANQIVDDDEQTFLDDGPDLFEEVTLEKKSPEKKSLNEYSILFLQNSRALYDLDVPVFIRANEIMLKSPFGKMTDRWMNRCKNKAVNVSDEVKTLISRLAKTYLIEDKKISDFTVPGKSDFASSLTNCPVIYRMIDSLNDDSLRWDVVYLDKSFSNQQIVCSYHAGRILETIVRDYIRNPYATSADDRKSTSYEMFQKELNVKCRYRQVDERRLTGRRIYSDWVKCWPGKQGMPFKAAIADIVLKTDLVYSDAIYPDFFNDLFEIYDSRNAADHADRQARIDPMMIRKLEKTLKVLFQLI